MDARARRFMPAGKGGQTPIVNAHTGADDVTGTDLYRTVCNRLDRTVRAMTAQIEFIRRETPEHYYGDIFAEVPKARYWVGTGWRRSRHIADKICASLASTGTPSYFIQPGEANHHFRLLGQGDRCLFVFRRTDRFEWPNRLMKTMDPDVPVDIISDQATGWLRHPGVLMRIVTPEPIAPEAEREIIMLAVGDSLLCGLESARRFTEAEFLKDHPKGALGKGIAAAQASGKAKEIDYLQPAQQALASLAAERDGIVALRKAIDEESVNSWLTLYRRPWKRIITTGMGKPGYLMRYIAWALNELERPAFYLHPAEGVHGDLGRIGEESLVIAYSHSGETEEILNIVPRMKERGATLLALTNNTASTLGRAADAVLKAGAPEVDPIGKAPTGSTTAALALATALIGAEIPV